MEKNKSRWFKWQRGQALVEYWATIPAGIVLMLMAAGAVSFIVHSFGDTLTGLNPGALTCGALSEADEDGPEIAHPGCHTIQLTARYYDDVKDRTTLAYTVTSGCDPSISHWTLGLGNGVADRILSSSEDYVYGTDPRTGVTGIKFDTGYETSKQDSDTDPGKKGKKTSSYISLTSTGASVLTTDSRTVFLTLGGYFDWEIVNLGVKAGTQTYIDQITAPVISTELPDDEQECSE